MDDGLDGDPDEVRLHQRMAGPPPRRSDVAMSVLLVLARPLVAAAAWLTRVVRTAARVLATAVSLPVWLLRRRRDDW
jgi:hypothetical protein